MEVPQIVMWGLGTACTLLGWFARELYAATQSLRKDLSALQVQISSDYVRYDRLKDAFQPVMDSLAEIKHAMERKADK